MKNKRRPHNRIKLNVDYIVKEYNKGRSAENIGDELGVSKKTILTRLKEQRVSRRQSPKYEEVTKEVLTKLYISEKLSTRSIAEIYGCSNKLILKRLYKYGIPVRLHAGDPSFSEIERKNKWGRPLELHNLWRGGVTSINESLRSETVEWRNDVMGNNDYKCFVTGEVSHKLHAHHSRPFAEIRDEAISELGLNKRRYVKDYTLTEIKELKKLVYDKHKSELGYALDSNVHHLLHKIYGQVTTDSDVHKFKERYLSGEFDKKEEVI